MNILNSLSMWTLLLTEIPSICTGYSVMFENLHGVVHTVSVSHTGNVNHASTFNYHSGGSSTASGGVCQSLEYPPYDGRPQGYESAPQDARGAVNTYEAGSNAADRVQSLVSESLVDLILDALPFSNDDDRNFARGKITQCIADRGERAVDMLLDPDVYREFFLWELTFWNCYIDAGKCSVGWNVVPASLIQVSMDYVQGLPLTVSEWDNDRPIYRRQKWMMTHLFEVTCISSIQDDKDDWDKKLSDIADIDNNEIPRRYVRRFLSEIKMHTMERALVTRQHSCFDLSEKDEIIGVVKHVANTFGISCPLFSGFNVQQRDSTTPPKRTASFRKPPAYGNGHQERAPGT